MSLLNVIVIISIIFSVKCCESNLPNTPQEYGSREGQLFCDYQHVTQAVCFATAKEGNIEGDEDTITAITSCEWKTSSGYDILVVDCGFSDPQNRYVTQGDKLNSALTLSCDSDNVCSACRRITDIDFDNLIKTYHPGYKK